MRAVALLVMLLAGGARPVQAADPAKGKATFEIRCAACHGTTGNGDGPAAAAITPPPRNFRDPAFWKDRTAEQIAVAVREGRPGTLMAPFKGVLSPTEIDDVVAYVQSFRPAAH